MTLDFELSKHWQSIADGLREAIMVVDKNGKIVFANQPLLDHTGFSGG
jgi:PAS domain S-box-containing protein